MSGDCQPHHEVRCTCYAFANVGLLATGKPATANAIHRRNSIQRTIALSAADYCGAEMLDCSLEARLGAADDSTICRRRVLWQSGAVQYKSWEFHTEKESPSIFVTANTTGDEKCRNEKQLIEFGWGKWLTLRQIASLAGIWANMPKIEFSDELDFSIRVSIKLPERASK